MIHRLILSLLLWTAVGQAAQPEPLAPCVPVSGDRIFGRDLAGAVPLLAGLPPDLIIGYSPLPGAQRIFWTSDLQKLAWRYGLTATIPKPVCFAWPLHQLTKDDVGAALLTALAGRKVDLEIVDQCRIPVPFGPVVFPLPGLSAATDHAALWNGHVLYADGRKFSTWVQVKVTIHEQQVIAAKPIRAGAAIELSDLQMINYSGPMRRDAVVHADVDAKGKLARQPISAGAVVLECMLSAPWDVERDQLVIVHINCGGAHIETQGIAVQSGSQGSVIKIRNPKTGRIFLAQINERGVVTVVPGGDVGLVKDDKRS